MIHWHSERDLERLLEVWPDDPRCDLLIVDNGSTALPSGCIEHVHRPSRNLGFAGAVNWACRSSAATWLLILNPDIRPASDALTELLLACERFPDAAGIVPALHSEDGTSQDSWQLRRLPEPWELVAQTLFLNPDLSLSTAPRAGSTIPQPAAAALLLHRQRLLDLDGFDQGFYPAWFEDVDFCKRLAASDLDLRYWPKATFSHRLGGTVKQLGYGTFLWIYFRHLDRYLGKHHAWPWRLLARCLLPFGLLARMAFLPLRRPWRAASRRQAAGGLATALVGALTGWRRPVALRRAWQPDHETCK